MFIVFKLILHINLLAHLNRGLMECRCHVYICITRHPGYSIYWQIFP
nr:MAG TPA: hypothetical protein [Caudoviricetes sp.]DAY73214.1 MAG TPA: hypothetical protein [Caudoviricetes sp.]